jgi:tryptophan synthase alpha chain
MSQSPQCWAAETGVNFVEWSSARRRCGRANARVLLPTRIGERFDKLKRAGRKGFVAFVTAGDPSLDRTVEIALEMDKAGVDVLELGVPFSDPLADGPVIQRSSQRALEKGVTLKDVLGVVRRIRTRSEIPIVLFGYSNPFFRYGLERAVGDAKQAGVDGSLVTDLPPEEAAEWLSASRAADLDTIFLAAPTSPPERLKRVAEASRGFVYAVSRTGVTGERDAISLDAAPLVESLKQHTRMPVALGFGIAKPEQVKAAGQVADAIVVGTALVRFIEEQPDGDVAGKIRWLKGEI